MKNHAGKLRFLVGAGYILCCLAAAGAEAVAAGSVTAASAVADAAEPETAIAAAREAIAENRPFPVFSEGVAAGFVTRLAGQQNRSNFVFSDTLVGAYVQMASRHMQPFDSLVRLSVYYPLSFKFNGHPYSAKNVIRYSADLFAGVQLPFSMWNVVNFCIVPGIHFNFQNADRFNFILLGGGAMMSMELPLARRWTLVLDGIASYDYANLGTNRDMEPYDHAWMYQLSFGVRYSKKSPNRFSYIRAAAE